jgi:isopenicillin N synthase-like dioxygenase
MDSLWQLLSFYAMHILYIFYSLRYLSLIVMIYVSRNMFSRSHIRSPPNIRDTHVSLLCTTMFFLRVRATICALPRSKGRYFASVASDFRIPVIDFAKFRAAKSDAEKKDTAKEIVGAFKDSGFIYVSNHGISEDKVSNVFQKSAEFFKMPDEMKAQLAWEDPRSNRGYVAIGRERVTQSSDAAEITALREKAPDFKETMEIGRDWDSEWKNQWPKENDAPEFKKTMLDFFQTCHSLHVEMMRSIALGLDLSEDFFDSRIDQQCHNLRLLSYPAIRRALLDGLDHARAGAHSDYGTLTLLFQDSVGGLEVLNPHTGTYVPARPIPGTIVINVGDLLARWSNDALRSTLHRVVAPPAKMISSVESVAPARQSIAFFSNPNFDAEIACLPNCGTEPKYPPINTEKYIVGRLAATYM